MRGAAATLFSGASNLIAILFGALFPLAIAYALGGLFFRGVALPRVARFGLGAAIESLAVFALLLAGWANSIVFLAGGFAIVAAWVALAKPRPVRPRWPAVLPLLLFAPYFVLYFVHALAPEIQPDALGYHLSLVSEYVRLGAFPHRIGFFEMLPQGLEMLFTVAFAFGQHSAAKLVHFAFLIAAIPLILAIGRRLLLDDRASLAAAALYFYAPVAGVSGTCAYNDAAFVFFALTAAYLLMERRWAAAGIAAGFCYAIKFPGLPIAPAAVLAAAILARRLRPPLLVAATALLMIAPWMVRDAVTTHNPVAPLFNRAFPNPWFRFATEQRLNDALRTYSGFTWKDAPLDYALHGNLQGTIGPAFLLLPVALIALRKRVGRAVWLIAGILLIPWLWNVGTRFLMPSLPWFALAMAMALPRRLLWACVALQALLCWPPILARYASSADWRLDGFPWKAALRLQAEPDYLRGNDAYETARMMQAHTAPGERIFALTGVGTAYATLETTEFWHSAQASQLTDALIVALPLRRVPLRSLQFTWPEAMLRGLRFRVAETANREWKLFEIALFSRDRPVDPIHARRFDAWPNVWEAPLAFDGNAATCWRTWGPIERGMFLEVDFERSQPLARADLLCQDAFAYLSLEVHGLGEDGRWRVLSDAARTAEPPAIDFRRAAVAALKRTGYRYVLSSVEGAGTAEIGKDMLASADAWGVEDVAKSGDVHLFRLR